MLAVILEAGWKDRFDELWLAYAPHEELAHRLSARHGGDAETARKRIAAQLPTEEQRIHADVIICTDGTHEQTRAIVRAEWGALLARIAEAGATASPEAEVEAERRQVFVGGEGRAQAA